MIDENDIKPELEKLDKEIIDKNIKITNLEKQIGFFSESNKVKESVNQDVENLKKASFNDKRELIKKYIKIILKCPSLFIK